MTNWYVQTTRNNSIGLTDQSGRFTVLGHENNTGTNENTGSITFSLAKVGTGGNGTLTAKIWNSSAVVQHTSTNSISESSLTTTFTDTTFNFGSGATVEDGWTIGIHTTGNASGDNFTLVGVNITTGDTERIQAGSSTFTTFTDRLITVSIAEPTIPDQQLNVYFYPDNNVQDIIPDQQLNVYFYPDNNVQDATVSSVNWKWWLGMRYGTRKRYGTSHVRRMRV
jgi:hypothetical protein